MHGNEVDAWNVTDHEAIRRIGKKLTHGRAVEPWVPNAGAQLVIDVMNSIKKTYPFVDLLKPETNAVLPALLALDSKAFGQGSGSGFSSPAQGVGRYTNGNRLSARGRGAGD